MTATLTVRSPWGRIIYLPLPDPLTSSGAYALVAGLVLLVAPVALAARCWTHGEDRDSELAEFGLWVCRWGLVLAAAGFLCWAYLEAPGPAPVPWEGVLWRLGIALAALWLRRRWRRWAYLAFPGLRRRYFSEVYSLQLLAEYVEQLEHDRPGRAGVRPGPPRPNPVIGRTQPQPQRGATP
jgi:hypothetical protein